MPHSVGFTLLPLSCADDDALIPPPKKRSKRAPSGSDDSEDQSHYKKRSAQRKHRKLEEDLEPTKPINSGSDGSMTVPAPLKPAERAEVVKGYGLSPGVSPYPGYSQPSHNQGYEAVRLLEQHHGTEQVMPRRVANLDRTGCGDVQNILGALLRTYISMQCNVIASNAALQSLGRVYGVKDGSPDLYAVLQGPPEQLRDALRSRGMPTMKTRNILRTYANGVG
ncbi:HhH-GPD family base excision DNA repair protein [Teratosphaeria destructans]|uniref:HhH-GPD family base excision DNA repair protein n=1 Tax=Teratosphaeria destructans TaxID=418781 RepID=A0A9W7T1I6_9PEZI|nr:HhH-GPD family base excision DNA repair protein [Teratosphaeria destructans]